jgi:hypothetical protein
MSIMSELQLLTLSMRLEKYVTQASGELPAQAAPVTQHK